ncbi:hypothetical protein DP116_00325 [Brasilonema bromeliae SPC951]|uniref:GUN4-like domain-containing protein n=1 Tax=Brasilonema bromeliae SPC951 TaxID=385972 RepID=A0ABX1P0X3_9CYAN|nr:hypothetical protein [Brasilonema bromeliae SPC951]
MPRKVNPPIPQVSISNPQPKIQNQQSIYIATPVVSSKQSSQGILKWLEGIIPKNSKSDDEIRLITAKMDYTQLRDLLTAGNWKQADEETRRVMLAVARREKEGWLNGEDIDHFPCEDLRTIDQLWVKYSNGRFGFSVQKGIYQSLGGTREYDTKIWEAFADAVGWRLVFGEEEWWSGDIFYDYRITPKGHLPVGGLWGWLARHPVLCLLLSRRDL